MGLAKGGVAGGANADECMGRASRLGQQPLDMLGRAFVLLMVELVDGPRQQLTVEVAVVHRRAVDPVGVQLPVPLQIAGDAVVIELASCGKVGQGQQVHGQPLALFTPVLLLADLVGIGATDGAVVVGAKRLGMDGHHLLPRVLQLAPECHLGFNLHLLVPAHRRLRQEDGLAAQGKDPELAGMVRHIEGEQRLGGDLVVNLDGDEIRRLPCLLQVTGEVARHAQSDKGGL